MTEKQLPVSVRASLTATVSLLILLISMQSASALSNGGGGTWPYFRDIIITNPGAALSDYQVPVSLSSNSFPAGAHTDGGDVRFTDAGGAE